MNLNKKEKYFGSYYKGFTLIELLVVISIIGVLASILMVSLTVTRNKGKEAAVQSNLNTVRSEMELFFLINNESYGSPSGSYSNCLNEINLDNIVFGGEDILNALISALGSGNGDAVCTIGPNGDSWALSIPLASGESWCVGSVGFGGEGTASGGGASAATCS